jgi:dihydropteroate synthase
VLAQKVPAPLRCGPYTITFDQTRIMGIINVTSDSFSDGGQFLHPARAIEHGLALVEDGADILDIGGESTRPGSDYVSAETELERVLPVIERLLTEAAVPISIDTRKPEVARECLRRGVHMVNDVGGLCQPEMREVVAEFAVPAVIMHMQGEPKTMQQSPHYDDVVREVKQFLEQQVALAQEAGISQLIVDPGIGFGKTLEHNLEIMRHLDLFAALGYPLLLGTSRKSFIKAITGVQDPLEREPGTIASNVIGVIKGVNILRVHNVKACKQSLQVCEAILDRGT